MRVVFLTVFHLLLFNLRAQVPIYKYLNFETSLSVPETINSERTAVIVHVPDENDDFRKVGNWEALSEKAHQAFVKMGIDAIFYLNHYALAISEKSKASYQKLFDQRKIENIIFLTQSSSGYEIMICKYSGSTSFISSEKTVFYHQSERLYDLLIQTGIEIKRADYEAENFLIPEKPSFVSGISIVEKSVLKNYPGILRRSKLVVERIGKLTVPESTNDEIRQKIGRYNEAVDEKNKVFEKLMESYPYEYTFIEPMSDEDLLRNRYQFVLRFVSGQASTLRQMLDYSVSESETDYVSTIPIMPDQTRAKPIPKDAIIHKFYIRQNISKNIHVGVWDADVTWEEALNNMIGNLIQEHNVDK